MEPGTKHSLPRNCPLLSATHLGVYLRQSHKLWHLCLMTMVAAAEGGNTSDRCKAVKECTTRRHFYRYCANAGQLETDVRENAPGEGLILNTL